MYMSFAHISPTVYVDFITVASYYIAAGHNNVQAQLQDFHPYASPEWSYNIPQDYFAPTSQVKSVSEDYIQNQNEI